MIAKFSLSTALRAVCVAVPEKATVSIPFSSVGNTWSHHIRESIKSRIAFKAVSIQLSVFAQTVYDAG
jgi:hypothetical protein